VGWSSHLKTTPPSIGIRESEDYFGRSIDIRDGPFDFSWGGGAFLRVLDFFLDLTDSARLFFIESCRVHDIFLNFFYYSVNTIIPAFSIFIKPSFTYGYIPAEECI
jgi:hypothetical protein